MIRPDPMQRYVEIHPQYCDCAECAAFAPRAPRLRLRRAADAVALQILAGFAAGQALVWVLDHAVGGATLLAWLGL